MNNSQANIFNAVRRVQNFLDANDAILSTVNKSATRADLDDVATLLGSHAGNQAAGKINAKGETANQRTLRHALRRDHMMPIADIANLKLKDVPNFAALTLPPSHDSAAKTVIHAGAMAQAAAQYEHVFVSAGLVPDFVAKLQAAAAAVQASIDTRSKSLGQKSGATGGLKSEETRARKVLKVLTSIVVPALSATDGHSALLAEWKSIRRVTSKLGPVTGSLQAARVMASAAEATPTSGAESVAAPAAAA